MATWGVEARIVYRAWNTSANAGVAGDSANHTLTLRRAGADSAFVGTVNDLGDGVYEAVVSDTLAETYELAMRGTSATADVVLFFEAPVRTVKAGALTPEQATQLAEMHAKAMLIGDYPQILVDRDPAIGERFSIHKGADYKDSLSNALRIVDVGGSVLPAATTQVKIEIGHRVLHHQFVTIDGAIEADGSDLVAVFDVLATDTAGLSPGPCDYSIYEFKDDQWRRLDVTGQCQIERGIRGA